MRNKIITFLIMICLCTLIASGCGDAAIRQEDTENSDSTVTEGAASDDSYSQLYAWEYTNDTVVSDEWGMVYAKTEKVAENLIAFIGKKSDKEAAYVYLCSEYPMPVPGVPSSVAIQRSLYLRTIYFDEKTNLENLGTYEVLDPDRIVRDDDGNIDISRTDPNCILLHKTKTYTSEIDLDELYKKAEEDNEETDSDHEWDIEISGAPVPDQIEDAIYKTISNKAYIGKKELKDKTIYAVICDKPLQICFITQNITGSSAQENMSTKSINLLISDFIQ